MSGTRSIASHLHEEGSRIIGELLNFIKEQIETKIEDALHPHDQRPQSPQESDRRENGNDVLEAVWLLHSEMDEAMHNRRDETERIEERMQRMQSTLDAMDRNIKTIVRRGRSDEDEQESRVRLRNGSPENELESVVSRMESVVLRLEERFPGTYSPSVSRTLSDPPCASSTLDSFRTGFSSPTSTVSQPTPEQREILGRLLVRAVTEGKEEVVRALLNAGAEVNISNGFVTALLEASSHAHATILYLLLESGADVNAKTSGGDSALHFAAASDHSGRCVSLLINAGADVHCANDRGVTPLHQAALIDSEASVRALLEAGANKNAEDKYGHTPLTFATLNSIKELLDH